MKGYTENPFQPDSANETAPTNLILELSRQLRVWREHLPSSLDWNDDEPEYGSWEETTMAERQSTFPDAPPLRNIKAVLNASLQTRYKYAQYLLWRPYVYKVLHFPSVVTEEDLHGCREMFKVSLSGSQVRQHLVKSPFRIGVLAMALDLPYIPRPETSRSTHLRVQP